MNKTKYALVTGTDHGVGLALAKELINRGFYVLACRLNEKETQIDELAGKYPEAMTVIKLDISSDADVALMKETVKRKTSYIDLIINDAGILGDIEKNLGDDLDFDEMKRVIDVNALGALRVNNALYDLLMQGEDKTIVNISSEAGSIKDCGRENWFGYCISKAANNMQSALVHNKIRPNGGKVIAVHPGHVATYMRGHLDTSAKIDPETSAKGILHVVLDTRLPVEDRPQYVDYRGEKLPW